MVIAAIDTLGRRSMTARKERSGGPRMPILAIASLPSLRFHESKDH